MPTEVLATVYQSEWSLHNRGEVEVNPVNENDEDNNNDDNDDDEDTDDEEEEEVDFPNQGNIQRRRQMVQGGKQPRNPIAAKNLNLIRAPRWGKSSFAKIAAWNRSACQGAWNEMKRGWMAKNK